MQYSMLTFTSFVILTGLIYFFDLEVTREGLPIRYIIIYSNEFIGDPYKLWIRFNIQKGLKEFGSYNKHQFDVCNLIEKN